MPEQAPQATILVVDDDPDLRDSICHSLRAEGMISRSATNGRQAAEILSSTKIDLVVTDLFMPDADGIETIRYVRRQHARTPILAVSANTHDGGMDYLAIAKKLGADAALAKPFRRRQLLETVHRLLADARCNAPPAPAPHRLPWADTSQ